MIFLSFFIPPAIYLLTLAFRNRGRHPVMLSACWDFAGVVFALSGFLLLGGPAVLHAIYHHWRLSWALGRTHVLNGIAAHWAFWVSLWILYFVVVFGCIAYMIWRRRNQTSIYNIEPVDLAPVLMAIFERLGLAWSQEQRGRILLGNKEDSASFRKVALDLESFPALRHVTLHWSGDYERTRAVVEEELELVLEQAPAANGPAANWFLSASLCLFLLSFSLLLLFVIRALRSTW